MAIRSLAKWRQRARQLKVTVYALYLAYRDPRVPWYAKLWCACLLAYAFSPIDLVPDPIPVLGQLDDLILIPLGVALALKMIPQPVLDECRERAEATLLQGKATNWAAACVIIALWLLLAASAVTLVARLMYG